MEKRTRINGMKRMRLSIREGNGQSRNSGEDAVHSDGKTDADYLIENKTWTDEWRSGRGSTNGEEDAIVNWR